MNFSNATILITGGNSGIGRGLAEALAARGATVIVTGLDRARLAQVLDANPGMSGYELDVSDARAIERFAATVIERHPVLNAVIHNAGILVHEAVLAERYDLEIVEREVDTNLLGPIWLTAALMPHLRRQEEAAIVTVSSGLAFVPLASASTYSATKAAIHAWSQSLHHEPRDTGIEVVEIAPPMVAAELTPGQSQNPHAMPLAEFVSETVDLLCATTTPDEVLVQRVMLLRTAERTGNFANVFCMLNPA